MDKKIIKWIKENYLDSEVVLFDGFEEAFIGVAENGNDLVAVYDRNKCLEILRRDMSENEAIEYFMFNVEGTKLGDSTPLFVTRIDEYL